MIINRMTGGGASNPINYAFAIYASSGDIPASASENSIASVSSVAVPSGGLMYREDIPTARDNGAVLQTGDVVVMPNKGLVFQYTGTSWLSLYTKIRTNGAWQMFFDLWKARGWAANSGFAPANPTLTINSGSVTFSEPAGYSGVLLLLPNFDLTPFSAVRIRASTTADGASKFAGLYVAAEGAQYYDAGANAKSTFTGTTITSRSLNISAINNRRHVFLGAAAGTGTVSITAEQVELVL